MTQPTIESARPLREDDVRQTDILEGDVPSDAHRTTHDQEIAEGAPPLEDGAPPTMIQPG